MRKIIALVLVIGCVLSLASCGLFVTKEPQQTPDDATKLPDIQAKVDAAAPAGADITVAFKTSLGELVGTYDVLYNEDGTASVAYSYEKFNPFTEGEVNTELKTTVSGNVTVAADGTVNGDLGTEGLTAVSFDLALKADKLSNVSINAGVLIATVKAQDTEAILGVALDYDAQLTVATSAIGVTSMTVAYQTSLGEIEIVTLYK